MNAQSIFTARCVCLLEMAGWHAKSLLPLNA